MSIIRLKTQNAVRAEARGEAINQETDFFFCSQIGIKTRGFGFETLHLRGRKADKVKSKTRIKRIGQRVQFFAEQAQDNVRIAGGHAQGDAYIPQRTIGAEECCLQPPRPHAIFLHPPGQGRAERLECGDDQVIGSDRFGKGLFMAILSTRQARRNGLSALPQNFIESGQYRRSKARGDFGALAAGHLPHGFQSGAAEGVADRGVKAQSLNRQRRDGFTSQPGSMTTPSR